jgi:hypothetical protein
VFNAYHNAKKRCTDLNDKNYGGRGIEFRFTSFEEFYMELGDPPPGMSLGRINNDGHYEPGNVRWETDLQQANNTRNNRPITAFGVTHNLSTWARMLNTPMLTIKSRLDGAGLPPGKALAHVRIPPGCLWMMQSVPASETYSATDSWQWSPYDPAAQRWWIDATANAALLLFGA